MNAPACTAKPSAQKVFDHQSLETFQKLYPETPHRLDHRLGMERLLELDALANLAEQIPAHSIEYNRGDLPIGVDGKPGATGLSIGETIRSIHAANSWAVLKNVEQAPAYRALIKDLLEELRPAIEAKTGQMLTPQGYVFISSPNAVTPYHFDPEHNVLLQVEGSKTMTQFPPGDPRFARDEVHESYHTGGPRELEWNDRFLDYGKAFNLTPGTGVFVPVMAPHFVQNGPVSSISLSITWRSEWSYAESEARALNHRLRKLGLSPKAPGRWPMGNRAKSTAYKVLRKLKLAG